MRQYLRASHGRSEIAVENDQIGSPTFAEDLAILICRMITTERYGVYHATNGGYCSLAELAEEILTRCGSRCRVRPVQTEHHPHEARRSRNLRLDMSSLDAAGFPRLPDWRNALGRFLDQLGVIRS